MADALQEAALADGENPDLVMGSGRYLLMETDTVHSATVLSEARNYMGYMTINLDKLYVPTERSDDRMSARSLREPNEPFIAGGRTSISIGRVESGDSSRQNFIVNTQTGALIGERRIALSGCWGFPAGTTTGVIAVRASVVDYAR